ncbi:MAG: T9SS type A sorting domain-containing protein [Candidatus Hatepunaea meridiana]|nr:T9SS type A sorting domain-containing protein [Candidatus Hatepunaea meridiana]
MKLQTVLSAVLIVFLLSLPVNGQDSLGVTKIGQLYDYWSRPYEVETNNDRIYLASGTTGIRVIRFTQDEFARDVGYNEEIYTKNITLDEDYIYALGKLSSNSQVSGLFVLTQSIVPAIIGVCELEYSKADIAVQGNYAYIAVYRDGLAIIDISDPENPEEISVLDLVGRAWRVVVSGEYAYLANDDEGLSIVDVSNPEEPEEVGMIDETVLYVTVNDELAFLSNESRRFSIYNISNPEEPERVFSTDQWDSAIGKVVIIGETALVISGSYIHAIDISNPAEPRFVSELCLNGEIEDIFIDEDRGYVVSTYELNPGGVVWYIDLSDLEDMQVIDLCYSFGMVYNIKIYNNYAFIPEGRTFRGDVFEYFEDLLDIEVVQPGVNIVDISDPTRPLHVTRYSPNRGDCTDIEITDDLTYMVGGINMEIADVVDDNNLQRVNSFRIARSVDNLTVVGNYAYLGSNLWREGFYIYDISDPEEPELVCNLREIYEDLQLNVTMVRVVDNIAYLAALDLIVLDVSDPREPELISVIDDRRINSIGVREENLFATVETHNEDPVGLWILDISEPDNPQSVSFIQTEYSSNSIIVDGNYAFFSGGGLHIFDISDPENPEETGFYPGYVGGIAVQGRYAVVEQSCNLSIFDCAGAIGIEVPPEWVEYPEQEVEINEGELLEFTIRAYDGNGDDLSIEIDRDNLPEAANFEDNADGNGTFSWQIGFEDANTYRPGFTVSDGEEEDEIEVIIIVHELNRSPEFRITIPDIILDEDPGIVEIADLDTVFSDPDGDWVQYGFDCQVEALGMLLHRGTILAVNPEQDFSLSEGTIITYSATDENDATTDSTFRLTINPVNDLPTGFNLMYPPDSSHVPSEPEIRFIWYSSIDYAEDSTVAYSLVFSYRDGVSWFRDIPDSSYVVPLNELFDNDNPHHLEWWVWAYDGIDSVRSDSSFILLPPTSAVDINLTFPTELTLVPVYPNPFNSTTTIRYGLPSPSHVSLQVYNTSGQQITTLFEGYRRTGIHSVNLTANNLPTGLYFVRLKASEQVFTQKVMLIR